MLIMLFHAGVGGFGEIYLCSEDTSKNVGEDATLAMKIEPHENGPLFVEMNFYLRAASPEKGKINFYPDMQPSLVFANLLQPATVTTYIVYSVILAISV